MKVVNSHIIVLGNYVNSKTKIEVKCSVCGCKWEANPNSLLSHKGCPSCAGTRRKTHREFIEQMKEMHPEIVVLSEYINNRTKVKCLCKQCNDNFYGIPHAMLDSGNGCPICSSSRGERKIRNWLNLNNIRYISEYKFSDCIDINPLPFDFYIPSKNITIEFDGKQHYEPNTYFGGERGFLKTQKHDKIKTEYCLRHNIKLIRIPYWDFDNIDIILHTELKI